MGIGGWRGRKEATLLKEHILRPLAPGPGPGGSRVAGRPCPARAPESGHPARGRVARDSGARAIPGPGPARG